MNKNAKEIASNFLLFDSWEEKYEYIIDLGSQLETFPDELKINEHLVRGCQSQVWFKTHLQDNLFVCKATSDSAIVSGLIALL